MAGRVSVLTAAGRSSCRAKDHQTEAERSQSITRLRGSADSIRVKTQSVAFSGFCIFLSTTAVGRRWDVMHPPKNRSLEPAPYLSACALQA